MSLNPSSFEDDRFDLIAHPGSKPFASLISAIQALQPQGEGSLEAICKFLGYDLIHIEPETKPSVAVGQPEDSRVSVKAQARRTIQSILERLESTGETEQVGGLYEEWLITAKNAPPLPKPPPAAPVYRRPIEPLLEPRLTRAILCGAVSARAPIGTIDIEKLVYMLVLQQPIRSLPRQSIKTVRGGLQLLLDIGPAMSPFLYDVRQVGRQVLRHLGRLNVDVGWFSGLPTKGLLDAMGHPTLRYRLPPSRRPVLAVTDVGIGQPKTGDPPSQPSSWVDFAAQLTRQGSQLALLIPYPCRRFPPELSGRCFLLSWDRKSGVRSKMRRVHPERGYK